MDKKKKIAIFLIGISCVLILLSFFVGEEKYTISFDTAGGLEIGNKVVTEGTTIGELEVPPKEGYKFLYWTLDGKKCNDNDKITKDVHLMAVWEGPIKYKVTFNVDGGSDIETVEVQWGNVLVKPNNPTKVGYKFVEWQLDGVTYDFTTTITKDIELKAIWKQEIKLTINFESNGGSEVASQEVKENEVAKKPSNPTRNGYKFVEWQLDGEGYDFSSKVTKNIKLVAKWEKVVTYTVTFDSNSGSKVNSQTVEKDKVAKRPSNPTRSGYKFVEWQLDGKTYDFTAKVTKDIKLKAIWANEVFNQQISLENLENKLKSKESFILVIVQEGCSHCEEFTPKFNKVLTKYSISAVTINLSDLTVEETKKFELLYNISGTPTVIFVTEGEEKTISNRIIGNVSENSIISKLETAGYIK